MSYSAKGGHGYGNQKRSVRSVQGSRSKRSQSMDARLKAPIAKSEEQWMNDPSHYDLPNVDAPKSPQTINTPNDQVLNGDKKLIDVDTQARISNIEQTSGYKLETQTKEHIAHLEGMTREEFRTYRDNMDSEAEQMFTEVRLKNPIALRKLVSTKSSRINEINFNIAYAKFFK